MLKTWRQQVHRRRTSAIDQFSMVHGCCKATPGTCRVSLYLDVPLGPRDSFPAFWIGALHSFLRNCRRCFPTGNTPELFSNKGLSIPRVLETRSSLKGLFIYMLAVYTEGNSFPTYLWYFPPANTREFLFFQVIAASNRSCFSQDSSSPQA